MDSHLRWFRREIMLGVVRRLIVEVVVVATATAALVTIGGGTTFEATAIALALFWVYPIVRVSSALLLNPTSSSYVNHWERPSGTLSIDAPTRSETSTDLALTVAGFSGVGSFSEWGGAATDLYAHANDDTIAIAGSNDDVILLTTLTDGRTCVTTRHLIPPHTSLIMNHRPGTEVADLVTHHRELIADLLETEQLDHVALDINSVPQLLLTEWIAWQELGPLVGPFVDVEHRRLPSLLRVRVNREHILGQARTTLPTRMTMPAIDRQPQPETMLAPEPEPEPAREHPVSRLSILKAQAQLAAEQTDRALAAGDHT